MDRIDRLLREAKLAGSEWMSRAAYDALISEGKVSVAGKRVKKAGEQVAEGTEISVQIPPLGLLRAAAPADLLWSDPGRSLAFFQKPAGIASYPLLPWENETLANRVAAFLEANSWMSAEKFANLAERPKLEGGLLQRLDRDTSGLIAVALEPALKEKMRQAFSSGKFRKTYLAIASGVPAEGKHSFLISDAQGGKVKAMPSTEAGASSLEVRVLRAEGNHSLVEVKTSQGARHIVRAGMKLLNAPLVGDRDYEGDLSAAPFHQLHASKLELLEPTLFANFPNELEAAAPQSFLDCRACLGLH